MITKMISRGTFPKRLMRHADIEQGFTGADLIVNYGVQGARLRDYINRYPEFMNHPGRLFINLHMYGNKLDCIRAVQEDVRCPWSTESYAQVLRDGEDNWIAKPYWSIGGKNIVPAKEYDTYGGPQKCYYQKSLQHERAYEIRVHYFKWMDIDTWFVQKKTHKENNDALTWNHHTGGKFTSINSSERKYSRDAHNKGAFRRAKEATSIAGPLLGYQFGAADFIYTHDGRVFFLEWNLAPGITIDACQEYYYEAFRTLRDMSYDNVKSMIGR
jgi:hypothetical protein